MSLPGERNTAWETEELYGDVGDPVLDAWDDPMPEDEPVPPDPAIDEEGARLRDEPLS